MTDLRQQLMFSETGVQQEHSPYSTAWPKTPPTPLTPATPRTAESVHGYNGPNGWTPHPPSKQPGSTFVQKARRPYSSRAEAWQEQYPAAFPFLRREAHYRTSQSSREVERVATPPPRAAVKHVSQKASYSVKKLSNELFKKELLNHPNGVEQALRKTLLSDLREEKGRVDSSQLKQFLQEDLDLKMTNNEIEEAIAFYDDRMTGTVSVQEMSDRLCWHKDRHKKASDEPPPTPSLQYSCREPSARFQKRLARIVRSKVRDCTYRTKNDALRGLFRRYDRDQSGSLQFDEFAYAVRKDLGLQMTNSEVRKVMRAFDKDCDGSVSYDEIGARLCWEGGNWETGNAQFLSDVPPPTPRTTHPKIPIEERFQRRLKQVARTKVHDGTYRTLNEAVHGMFVQYDTDGSGNLGPQEVQNACMGHLRLRNTTKQDVQRLVKFMNPGSSDGKQATVAAMASRVCWSGRHNPIPPPTKDCFDETRPSVDRFNQRLMQMAAWKVHDGTYKDANEAIRGLFSNYDKDGNGRLQKEEIRACLKEHLGLPKMAKAPTRVGQRDYVGEVMAHYDDNGMGTISYTEFEERLAEQAHQNSKHFLSALQHLERSRQHQHEEKHLTLGDGLSRKHGACKPSACAVPGYALEDECCWRAEPGSAWDDPRPCANVERSPHPTAMRMRKAREAAAADRRKSSVAQAKAKAKRKQARPEGLIQALDDPQGRPMSRLGTSSGRIRQIKHQRQQLNADIQAVRDLC